MFQVQHDQAAHTLTIEWNNREAVRTSPLSLFLMAFWLIWLVAAGFATWVFATGRNQGPRYQMVIWLGLAYLGVVAIPLLLVKRYVRERVEFTRQEFRHILSDYAWFLPVRWPLETITQIDIGHYVNPQGDVEAIVTLNVWRGWRRTMIGYWLSAADKLRLFQAIEVYFADVEHGIEIEDNYTEE